MTSEGEWINGLITSTKLGIDEGFLLTFWVTVKGQSQGQSMGGYVLATDSKPDGFGKAFRAILNLLNVVGVEKWEDLKGQLVRIRFNGIGSSEPPLIGNILDYEKVWDIKKEMAVPSE